MKKLLMMVALVAGTVSVKAACVDWAVSGTADTVNYKVFLVTSVADTYDSVAEIAASAISSGTISKINARSYGTGTVNAVSESVTDTSMAGAFFVIVSGEDATAFNYVAADLSSKVYDPAKQESSKGAFSSVTAANILAGSSGTIGGNPPGPGPDVPEPTSGLLLLVGMAGLALRRKQK